MHRFVRGASFARAPSDDPFRGLLGGAARRVRKHASQQTLTTAGNSVTGGGGVRVIALFALLWLSALRPAPLLGGNNQFSPTPVVQRQRP